MITYEGIPLKDIQKWKKLQKNMKTVQECFKNINSCSVF